MENDKEALKGFQPCQVLIEGDGQQDQAAEEKTIPFIDDALEFSRSFGEAWT